MKIKKFAAFSFGTLVVFAVSTLALPRHITVERTALIDAAPQAVLTLAASNEGYQSFNPYLDLDPDLKIKLFGPMSGVGSGFHFDSKDGTGSQTVAGISKNTVSFAIDLGAMGQPTQAITAIETDAGTQVTWTMNADMGINPIARVMGVFMDRMIGPNFERGLAKIADVTA